MNQLFRDTVFGHSVRLLSRGRLFAYDEQHDPALVERYLASHTFSASNPLQSALDPTSEQEKLEGQNRGPSEGLTPPTAPRSVSPSRTGTGKDALNGEKANIDPENGADVHLVNWIEDDPANPMNWSTAKKFFVTFQICLLTTSVYIGSAIYTPGIIGIEEEFGVSQVAALLGLTLFIIGYALGPMIWAPMSEIPYTGRSPIYIGTLFAFVFLNFGVVYAKNFGMLLAFRFITGFVGSPVLATGGASIQDMYKPSKRAYGIAIWGVSAVCGPVMGPLVGGFAAESKGWRWTIWELIWLSGFCLVLLFFCLPETSASNILYRRTVRLRKLTGDSRLKCEPEIEAEGITGREITLMLLVRPFTLMIFEPIVFLLNLYIALVYALLYLWFESFPIVFIEIYGFTIGTEGLAFLGILLGVLVTIPPFFWYLHRYTEPQFDDKGELKPELRLPPSFVGAFFIPVCLFWFGWSARESVHWIMPIIGSAFFGVGAFILFNCVLNYLGDAYPKYAASVFAGNDLVRSAFGAAFPLFAPAMYKKLGLGWASSLLGFLAILFIPIPFLLFYYGESIRKRSKNAKHDS